MAASRLKPGAKRSHHGKGKAKEGGRESRLGRKRAPGSTNSSEQWEG